MASVIAPVVSHLGHDEGPRSALSPDDRGPGKGQLLYVGLVGLALVLYYFGALPQRLFGVDLAVLITILGGFPIFYDALADLYRLKVSGGLAVALAAVGALIIGEYFAAAEVIFIMLVGGALEEYATQRTRGSIRDLMELTPDTVRLRRGDEIVEVPVEEVSEGDIAVVRPGDRIPVDGRVIEGRSSVAEAAITGEPLPADKQPGSEVFAGTLTETGALDIHVLRVGEETTVARIAQLADQARMRKAPVQRLADHYAAYFVPAVLFVALGSYAITRDLVRSVSILIVACPCALVLATPTALVAAIGRMAREGILVKGGQFLEQAGRATSILFDKTGTLTVGAPRMTHVLPIADETEDELVRLAAAVESRSEHALAGLIVRAAAERELRLPAVEDFEARPGLGVVGQVEGQRVSVGNKALLEQLGIAADEARTRECDDLAGQGATLIHIARDDRLIGILAAQDDLRPHASEAVHELGHLGIGRCGMLTGDREAAAQHIARRAGVATVHSELLPHQKVEVVESERRDGERVLMVGDGINDAPALAAADVGIAMGDLGTDVTMEAADVVLVGGDLTKLPRLVSFSRRALRTIHQNIVLFAILANVAGVVAAATAQLGPVAAAVVHQISSLLVVLNSLRLLAGKSLRETQFGVWLTVAVDILRTPGILLSGLRLGRHARTVWAHRRRWGRGAVVAVAAGYALSGVYVIAPDGVGVIRRFGRFIGGDVEPGLHYHLPWPMESLTRLQVDRVRTVTIGYRLDPEAPRQALEPPAYEWNIQHRRGRYINPPEAEADEGLQITADSQLVMMNVAVQYKVVNSRAFLFRVTEPDGMVRAAAEGAVRRIAARHELTRILTDHRDALEAEITDALDARLRQYGAGVTVVGVWLQDVHPPIPVVDAFRDVSSALEERTRLINEAEGYANERLALSGGEAQKRLRDAEAYKTRLELRSEGDAEAFVARAQAYRPSRKVTGLRLLLEAIEIGLEGRRKLVMDAPGGADRRLYFMGEGNALLGVGPGAVTTDTGDAGGAAAAGAAGASVPGLPPTAFGNVDDQFQGDGG